jgi:hypothetical protein
MHQTGVVNTYGMEDLKRNNRCSVLDPELKPIMLAFLEGATLDQPLTTKDEKPLTTMSKNPALSISPQFPKRGLEDNTQFPKRGLEDNTQFPKRGAEGLGAYPSGSANLALVWFMKYANQLYESGISCIDLIKYLEEDLGVETEAKKRMTITLNFCFNKIKGEYRCEKMALFYLFDYMFFRSNKSLKNISFI